MTRALWAPLASFGFSAYFVSFPAAMVASVARGTAFGWVVTPVFSTSKCDLAGHGADPAADRLPPLPCWLAVHREIQASQVVRRTYDFLAREIPGELGRGALEPTSAQKETI